MACRSLDGWISQINRNRSVYIALMLLGFNGPPAGIWCFDQRTLFVNLLYYPGVQNQLV